MPTVHHPALNHTAEPAAGAVPAEASAWKMARRFDGTRSLAALLLGTGIAGLILVADRLLASWSQAQVVAAWIALCTVVVMALGLLAVNVRRLVLDMVARLDAWSARVARARAEARLWAMARKDARLMAALQAARSGTMPGARRSLQAI